MRLRDHPSGPHGPGCPRAVLSGKNPAGPRPHLPSGEKETLCTEPLKWKW